MRAVILEMLETLDANAAAALTPDLAERRSLQEFAETMVRHSLLSHRQNARMLRAMFQFIMSHPNMAFKKKAAELNARSIQRVADFLLLKRSEINHPDPKKALPLALMLVGIMLQHIIVLDALLEVPDPRLPRTDDELVEELTRAFLRYLGAEYRPKGAV